MARHELRKPIAAIVEEKSKFDRQLTDIKTKQTALVEKMQIAQRTVMESKTAIETLPNGNASKPARQVLEREISFARGEIQAIQSEYDELDKTRIVVESKIKSLAASWKELEKA